MPVPMQDAGSSEPGNRPVGQRQGPRPAGWVVGMMVFAAITLIMVGYFHAVAGLVALFRNEIYVVGPRYVFSLDVTAWGWVHLLLGGLAVAAGFALRSARTWARFVGIAFAMLSMATSFLFVPYYPVWSLLIITFDVLVICALCLYNHDAARS